MTRPEGGRPAAVLWDFDGTLMDTEVLWERVEAGFARDHGVEVPATFHAEHVGGTMARTAGDLKALTGAEASVEQIGEELWARMTALLSSGPVPWLPGARELVDALAASGVPQAVVSTSRRSYLDLVLRRLDPVFAMVVSGDDVERHKPHPEPYLRAAAGLGVRPEDAVVVEDSPAGAASGVAAGCAVLGVGAAALTDAPRLVRTPALTGWNVDRLGGLLG